MDWRSVKFDWNRARAFLITAEEGSFSAASRALGMRQPTLSRQVAALEKQLGVALFDRSQKHLILTPSGLELLDHVRAMAEGATRFSLAAFGQVQALEGEVCITATEMAAAYLLPSALLTLRETHPGIKVTVIASESPSDLRRREADIAIRTFRSEQPDILSTKIATLTGGFYASAGYLQRVGQIQSVCDLQTGAFIEYNESGAFRAYLSSLGLDLNDSNFPLQADRYLLHIHFARAGLGIVPLPDVVGRAEPSLTKVLPGVFNMDSHLWMAAHKDIQTNRRVRRVFDFLQAELPLLIAAPV